MSDGELLTFSKTLVNEKNNLVRLSVTVSESDHDDYDEVRVLAHSPESDTHHVWTRKEALALLRLLKGVLE